MKSAKNVKASPTELSSRNQSLLGIYSAEVEAAADKIISNSPSPVSRRQALTWKTEAIPAFQKALLNSDPVAAVLDSWVLIFQMRAYMESPAMKNAFAESHPIVSAALSNMDNEMEQLVGTAAPAANVSDLRRRASEWASNHPIRAGLAGRQSVDPDVIRVVGETDLGIATLLQTVDERLGDLSARLDAYNMYLPKQARWQAELLVGDLTRDPEIRAANSNLTDISGALGRTATRMDQLPDLMKHARAAVRGDIEEQRLAAQQFFQAERMETLDALHQERVETMAQLRDERLAATKDIRGERQAVFDALNDQEQVIVRDLNATTEKAIQNFDNRSRGLIDHFFVRALELVLLTVVVCALVVWTLLRWFVRRYAIRPASSITKKAA